MKLIRSMALAGAITLCLAVGAALAALASIGGGYFAHHLGMPVAVGSCGGFAAMIFVVLTVMCWMEDEE